MHYAKFIKYESGNYGFANKWVMGEFSSKQLKDRFMKIWTLAIFVSHKDLRKEIAIHKKPVDDGSKKTLEIHTIDFVRKEGTTQKVWETKSIKLIKPKEKKDE